MAKKVILVTSDGKKEISVSVKHADSIFCLQDRAKAKSNINRIIWVRKNGNKTDKRITKEPKE